MLTCHLEVEKAFSFDGQSRRLLVIPLEIGSAGRMIEYRSSGYADE